jgi:hypothetical protein
VGKAIFYHLAFSTAEDTMAKEFDSILNVLFWK